MTVYIHTPIQNGASITHKYMNGELRKIQRAVNNIKEHNILYDSGQTFTTTAQVPHILTIALADRVASSHLISADDLYNLPMSTPTGSTLTCVSAHAWVAVAATATLNVTNLEVDIYKDGGGTILTGPITFSGQFMSPAFKGISGGGEWSSGSQTGNGTVTYQDVLELRMATPGSYIDYTMVSLLFQVVPTT